MVNQKVVIEIASVIYAIATYLILKDNLTKMSKESTSKISKDESKQAGSITEGQDSDTESEVSISDIEEEQE